MNDQFANGHPNARPSAHPTCRVHHIVPRFVFFPWMKFLHRIPWKLPWKYSLFLLKCTNFYGSVMGENTTSLEVRDKHHFWWKCGSFLQPPSTKPSTTLFGGSCQELLYTAIDSHLLTRVTFHKSQPTSIASTGFRRLRGSRFGSSLILPRKQVVFLLRKLVVLSRKQCVTLIE